MIEGEPTGVVAPPPLTPAEPPLKPEPLESCRGGPGESSSVTTTEGREGGPLFPRPFRGLKMVAMEGRRPPPSSPILTPAPHWSHMACRGREGENYSWSNIHRFACCPLHIHTYRSKYGLLVHSAKTRPNQNTHTRARALSHTLSKESGAV